MKNLTCAKISNIVFAFAACSCTPITVQLYTEGADKGELQRLEEILEQNGYARELNTISVPPQITRPTLVYSPKNSKQIDTLNDLLTSNGFSLNLVESEIGNHYYSSHNAGIYLEPYSPPSRTSPVPPGNSEENSFTTTRKVFTAECPMAEGLLSLEPNYSFLLDIGLWGETIGEEKQYKYSGSWRHDEREITLSYDSMSLGLEIMSFELDMYVYRGNGKELAHFDGIKLINKSNQLFNCDFSYKERVR